MTEPTRPRIYIKNICKKHQEILLINKLHLTAKDPYMATQFIAELLLFQGSLMGDSRVHKRTGGDMGQMNLVLAEIGCLACFDRDLFKRVVGVMRKGLTHAAQVSQGKANDREFGFIWPNVE